jgi:hypothetical protein
MEKTKFKNIGWALTVVWLLALTMVVNVNATSCSLPLTCTENRTYCALGCMTFEPSTYKDCNNKCNKAYDCCMCKISKCNGANANCNSVCTP